MPNQDRLIHEATTIITLLAVKRNFSLEEARITVVGDAIWIRVPGRNKVGMVTAVIIDEGRVHIPHEVAITPEYQHKSYRKGGSDIV